MRRRAFLLGIVLSIATPFAVNETLATLETHALKAEVAAFAAETRGLAIGDVTASGHRLAIDGLSFADHDLRLRVGRLGLMVKDRLPALERLVQAAAADSTGFGSVNDAIAAVKGAVSADDVSIDTNELHVAIKHVELTGTSLSKADLLALFDTKSTTPASERLAKISATHIAIPEIEIDIKPKKDQPSDSPPQKIILHDVTMDDVVQGHAQKLAVTDITANLLSPDSDAIQLALGPTKIADVDLPKAAALIAGTLGAEAQAIPLCSGFDINGVKISVPKTKAEIGIASLSLKQVALAAKSDSSAHGASKFDIALLDFADLRFSGVNGASTWTGRFGHGALRQMIANKISEGHVENASVTGEGTTVTAGSFGWQGKFEVNNPSLPTAAISLGQQTITADALAVDLKGSSAPQGIPGHFQLSHFELMSRDPVDGIPTHSQARIDHFTFTLEGVKDGDYAELAALGYDKVDLSSQFESHFEPTKHQFDLDGWSLTGIGMGALHLSARLDQVSSSLFSADQSVVEAAAVKVLLHQLEIKIENTGLFEKLVAAAAKREGSTPEAIKAKFTQDVATNVPALLNNGRGSDVLVAALTKFIADPKNLRIGITAPEGVSALDTVLIKDPATLLQKIDITATANQ